MTTPTVAASTRSANDEQLLFALAEPLRDIARSGLAGALAGVVVGVAGRLAMRFATILNEQAVGNVTENGNRIGDITPDGTLALMIFGGVFMGTGMGVVWTAVAPWIPGTGVARGIVAAPIGVALAGFFVIRRDNPDFLILESDALVIALILGVVSIGGFTIAMADSWLQRRLPIATKDRHILAYGTLTLLGAALVLPIAIALYLGPGDLPWVGVALVVAGLATVARWVLHARGQAQLPPAVMLAGRGGLALAVVLGAVRLASEVGSILA